MATRTKPGNNPMEGIQLPDTPSQCKWARDKSTCGPSPHRHESPREPRAHNSILSSVLEAYGHTPLIRMDKLAQKEGLECDLLGKCEFFNAGGSIKDRIGVRMVEEAEREGLIKPGDTLIEPTSGNTGVAIALAAAVKGYKCILVMLDKNSLEKDVVLKALGAEIVRVPAAPFGTPDHYISIAHRMHKEMPNSYIFDQYKNKWNAIAHYDTLGEEILTQTSGKVDMVVIGAGTGGTFTGIGRKFKEKLPSCQIVAVDPYGSVLALPPELNDGPIKSYAVEGIGKKFIPTGMDRTVVDEWIKSGDEEGFIYARRIIKEEGLLVGGSSGSAVAAAVRAAKNLKKGQRCVVILPDSIRNYMSRFVNDDWMIDKGYLEVPPEHKAQWWWSKPVTELDLQAPPTVRRDTMCYEAVKLFKDETTDYIPVIGKDGDIVGVVTMPTMTARMSKAAISGTDPVSRVMSKTFKTFDVQTALGPLSRVLNSEKFAIITQSVATIPTGGVIKRKQICGIVTGTDLLNYIAAPPVQNGLNE